MDVTQGHMNILESESDHDERRLISSVAERKTWSMFRHRRTVLCVVLVGFLSVAAYAASARVEPASQANGSVIKKWKLDMVKQGMVKQAVGQAIQLWSEDRAPGDNGTWHCVQGFCMVRAVKAWQDTNDYEALTKFNEAACKRHCLTTPGCTSFVWAPHRHPVLKRQSCIIWKRFACDIERDNGLVWCHSDSGLSAGAGWTCCRPNEIAKTCQLRTNVPLITEPEWVPQHAIVGTTTITIKTGVLSTTEMGKTVETSSKVSASMGNPEVSGYGSEVSSSLQTSFHRARSTSEEKTFSVEIEDTENEKYLWQWTFVTKFKDGTRLEDVGTKEYAITAGKFQRPKCIPGFGDIPRYQTCHGNHYAKSPK